MYTTGGKVLFFLQMMLCCLDHTMLCDVHRDNSGHVKQVWMRVSASTYEDSANT